MDRLARQLLLLMYQVDLEHMERRLVVPQVSRIQRQPLLGGTIRPRLVIAEIRGVYAAGGCRATPQRPRLQQRLISSFLLMPVIMAE